MTKRNKIKNIIGAFGFLLMFLFLFVFADRVPPRSMTHGAMHMCKRRILLYARDHNEVPTSLDILPVISGYGNRVVDAWDRKITYIVNPDNTVTLLSLGKDGIEGGDGDNKDMIGVFPLKTDTDRWQDQLCDWIRDPFD